MSPSGRIDNVEIVGSPQVNQDRVTLRVKVSDRDGRPVSLTEEDFRIYVDEQRVELQDWKNPKEAKAPPARIVVLLDMSGSMRHDDTQGKQKLQGAVAAIKSFIELAKTKGDNTQITLAPFGDGGPGCPGYVVDEAVLEKYYLANDEQLMTNLNQLAQKTPCASTNLYDPLAQAVNFLGNPDNTELHPPENSNKPQPRLAAIFLSDGYDTLGNEEERFREVENLLERNPDVTVHTLGYGITNQELYAKYQEECRLTEPLTRTNVAGLAKKCNRPIDQEFVDRERLEQIAKTTGGIRNFLGNADAIARSLQEFLNTILGEYEITYTERNPERGREHSVNVVVDSVSEGKGESLPKDYRIEVFSSYPIPWLTRSGIFLGTLGLLWLGGWLPFRWWGQQIKKSQS